MEERKKRGYVEGEGFISTSLSKQIALKFMVGGNGNSLLVVVVEEKHIFEPGFANIKEYSRYGGEGEILFNLTNIFQVIDVERDVN